PDVLERPRSCAGRYLGEFASLQCIPRHRCPVDAMRGLYRACGGARGYALRLPADVTLPACARGVICSTISAKEDQPVATRVRPRAEADESFRTQGRRTCCFQRRTGVV